MRAVEPSRVLKVTVKVLHTLAVMAPAVFATVGAAALERLEMRFAGPKCGRVR